MHGSSFFRTSRLNLSEISVSHFLLYISIADQELDFLHLVVSFLSARKDLSGLSYSMSKGKCTDWKLLKPYLSKKEG